MPYVHCKWVALCCWNFAIFCIWPRPHLHEHLTEQGMWSGMSTRIGDENEIGVAKEMFHEADHLRRVSVQQGNSSDFLPFKDTGPTHKLHCLRPHDGLMLRCQHWEYSSSNKCPSHMSDLIAGHFFTFLCSQALNQQCMHPNGSWLPAPRLST